MKLFLKVLLVLLFVAPLYADYTNRLDSSIVLQNGASQTHNAILFSGSQYYTFGNTGSTASGSGFSISANGDNRATFTLIATKPNSGNKPLSDFSNFYIGSASITNVNANFDGFDEFTFTTGQTTLNNASLNLDLGNARNEIVGLIGSAKLSLNNSSFTSNAATLQLSKVGNEFNATNSTINLQSTKVNNYGTITLINTTAHFGAIINIGKESLVTGDAPAVSIFVNQGGNVTINGNFTNGGLSVANLPNPRLCAQGGECGGGNLQNLNGGNITITGNLVSKGDGGKESSIGIQGGNITIQGNVENQAGSTISFSSYNGTLGKLEVGGDFANQDGGKIQIDVSGVKTGDYSFLSSGGTISGLENNVEILNATSDFIQLDSSALSSGRINVALNQATLNAFTSSLDSNERSILGALESSQTSLFTQADSSTLKNILTHTKQGIETSYVSTPFVMIDSLKLTKQMDFYQKREEINFGAYGGGIAGANIGGGGYGGIYINTNFMRRIHKILVQLDYGYGAIHQARSNHTSQTQSHIFQASLLDRITFGKLEFDLGLYGSVGVFTSTRDIQGLSNVLSSRGSFGFYQVNLDSNVGYRFDFGRFTFKPFVGVNQFFNIQSGIKESGDVAISASPYAQYLLDMIVGVEGRILLGINSLYTKEILQSTSPIPMKNSYIFAKISYESMLFNSHKSIRLSVLDNPLAFDSSYFYKLQMIVGSVIPIKESMSVSVSGFYRASFANAHIFGVNASFGYVF